MRAGGRKQRLWLLSFFGTAMALVLACGGGAAVDSQAQTLSTHGGGEPALNCSQPALPARPAGALNVTDFGARPDDSVDDTVAIMAALKALAPGQWLVFPAGTYEHKARLVVSVPGSVLWSDGATLHATNPEDQAVVLAADGASIYNFKMTATTDRRLDAPWQARIAIFDISNQGALVRNNVIQGNRIVNGGEPGTPQANSSSSAGIYIVHAEGFLVAGNEIRRSLSDGIHISDGSRNGRVVFNTVRESGDDMIGMVSYMGLGDWRIESAADLATDLGAKRERTLVRNILVERNDLEGAYWGRGITVVGGADITIRDNRINRVAVGAGVLLAREAEFVSWGVDNVVVEGNTISMVQTATPAYTPAGWPNAGFVTGHGGIEVHAQVFDDERNFPALLQALAVGRISFANNSVNDALDSGIRIGDFSGESEVFSAWRDENTQVLRRVSGVAVGPLALQSSTLAKTSGVSIISFNGQTSSVSCQGITSEGLPLSPALCKAGPASFTATGSSLSCKG